jgi:hypothetical protein
MVKYYLPFIVENGNKVKIISEVGIVDDKLSHKIQYCKFITVGDSIDNTPYSSCNVFWLRKCRFYEC